MANQLKNGPRRVSAIAATVLAIPVSLVLGASVAGATTISVTPGAVDNVVNGNCSLVEAITAANTHSAVDACPAGTGSDVIVAPGTYVLSTVNNNAGGATGGATGLPVITGTVTIQSATIMRSSSAPDFRILRVAPSGNLTLSGVTLTGGRISCAPGCTAGYALGGGILSSGTLTVSGSAIRANTAECGVSVCSARGGGIYDQAHTLTLTHTSLSNNVVNCPATGCDTAAGGALFDDGGSSSISASQFGANSATCGVAGCRSAGGALLNNAVATIDGSTFSGNSATCPVSSCSAEGGGINANVGSVSLTHSQVAANTAKCGSESCAKGGGIFKANTAGVTLIGTSVVANVPKNCFPTNVIAGCTN